METHRFQFPLRRIVTVFATMLMPLTLVATARGDAASELASFSVFPKVDLAQLSGSDAKPVRGPG